MQSSVIVQEGGNIGGYSCKLDAVPVHVRNKIWCLQRPFILKRLGCWKIKTHRYCTTTQVEKIHNYATLRLRVLFVVLVMNLTLVSEFLPSYDRLR